MAQEKQREAKRTTLTLEIFVRALVAAWDGTLGTLTAAFAAMLWAKYFAETSNKHCYNFNIGNVKDAAGDGFDFHCLRGVWEGVSKAEADRLIASGQATLDPNEAHKAAVAPRVAVLFQPPHPATRFRSYDSLEHAMQSHLAFLAVRFPKVLPFMLAGDVDGFAKAMARAGYMTAQPTPYANAMRAPFVDAFAPAQALLEELSWTDEPPPSSDDESIPVIHGTHVVESAIEGRRANLGEALA